MPCWESLEEGLKNLQVNIGVPLLMKTAKMYTVRDVIFTGFRFKGVKVWRCGVRVVGSPDTLGSHYEGIIERIYMKD